MGRCRNRARIHTLAMATHLPTIYNARKFVEAGGVMSYGPNASDLFRRSADGREGGGQQAVSSLDLVPCAKCVQQNSAHSRESGIQAKDLGPCNGVPATRASRGAPRGDEERGVVLPRPENQNTHASVLPHWAARPLASKLYGPRAPRPRDKDGGIDRDPPPRDFATARRDRIGTDYGRSNAEASVAYRTIQ